MPGLSGSQGPFQASRGRQVSIPTLGTTAGSEKEESRPSGFRTAGVTATPTQRQGQGCSNRD